MADLDLDAIKDDIGMPPGDTTDDAWLQRRISGIIASMRDYTHRWLYPMVDFVDDFTPVQYEAVAIRHPPGRAGHHTGVTTFLKEIPVQAIKSCKLQNGQLINVADIRYDPRSGELLGLKQDSAWGWGPASFFLPQIVYTAGYEDLPTELYEVMVGILADLWSLRAIQKAGLGIGGTAPESVTISDVGSVRFSRGVTAAGSMFSSGTSQTPLDPLLGPYTATLDAYKDRRNVIAAFGRPITTMPEPTPLRFKIKEVVDGQPR